MKKIYENISELIGKTPLIRINKVNDGEADILAKVEAFNPGGSVKDRIAFNMVQDALDKGVIDKDTNLVEPTSGNTGIGLAFVCAALGLNLTIVMPETMSVERRKIIQGYGAKLVLSPGAEGMKGAIRIANEIKEEVENSYILQQFENAANPEAHYKSTADEIWNDTDATIDYFVAGVGTGGTISGVGKYLKEKNPKIQIIAVEAAKSPVLSGGKPGPHRIQGISAGFIPKVFNSDVVDEIIPVEDDDALSTSQSLSRKEGVLVGISSGAAMHGALTISKRPENKGKRIVVLLPDGGERYLSTDLFKFD